MLAAMAKDEFPEVTRFDYVPGGKKKKKVKQTKSGINFDLIFRFRPDFGNSYMLAQAVRPKTLFDSAVFILRVYTYSRQRRRELLTAP